MAIARAKTSRPQPWVAEIGAVNSPKLARTPKVSTAIRQPQATIIAGVRQPGPLELDPPGDSDMAAPIVDYRPRGPT